MKIEQPRFQVSVQPLDSRLEEQSALTIILAAAAAAAATTAHAADGATSKASCTIFEW